MSHTSVREDAGTIGVPPTAANGSPKTEGGLSAEAKAALLARARDVISGRVTPPKLEPPPGSLEFLQREFAGYEPPPTAEAIRHITDRWALVDAYKGEPIATYRTADGDIAVLGVGEDEIRAILRGLDHHERSNVLVEDTDPC